VAGVNVVLPSALQALAGGQSFLTAPAETAVTVEGVLDLVTGEYPALSRRLRDDRNSSGKMINFTELQLLVGTLGEELRASLATLYPWLPVAVVTSFSVANSVRIFAYIPETYQSSPHPAGPTATWVAAW